MTLAILGIIGTVISAVWYLWKRALKKSDAPDEIHRKRIDAVAKEIACDDAVRANVRLGDWLRAIKGDSERPGDSSAEGKPDVQPPR